MKTWMCGDPQEASYYNQKTTEGKWRDLAGVCFSR